MGLGSSKVYFRVKYISPPPSGLYSGKHCTVWIDSSKTIYDAVVQFNEEHKLTDDDKIEHVYNDTGTLYDLNDRLRPYETYYI